MERLRERIFMTPESRQDKKHRLEVEAVEYEHLAIGRRYTNTREPNVGDLIVAEKCGPIDLWRNGCTDPIVRLVNTETLRDCYFNMQNLLLAKHIKAPLREGLAVIARAKIHRDVETRKYKLEQAEWDLKQAKSRAKSAAEELEREKKDYKRAKRDLRVAEMKLSLNG